MELHTSAVEEGLPKANPEKNEIIASGEMLVPIVENQIKFIQYTNAVLPAVLHMSFFNCEVDKYQV